MTKALVIQLSNRRIDSDQPCLKAVDKDLHTTNDKPGHQGVNYDPEK